jgi:hypothetical protein
MACCGPSTYLPLDALFLVHRNLLLYYHPHNFQSIFFDVIYHDLEVNYPFLIHSRDTYNTRLPFASTPRCQTQTRVVIQK